MSNTNDRIEELTERLAAPKKVQTDSGTVENHSVDDQIKALKYLEQKNAQTSAKSQLKRMGFYKINNLE